MDESAIWPRLIGLVGNLGVAWDISAIEIFCFSAMSAEI